MTVQMTVQMAAQLAFRFLDKCGKGRRGRGTDHKIVVSLKDFFGGRFISRSLHHEEPERLVGGRDPELRAGGTAPVVEPASIGPSPRWHSSHTS